MSMILIRRVAGLATLVLLAACVQRAPADLPVVPGLQVDPLVHEFLGGRGVRFIRATAKLTNRGGDSTRFTLATCPLVIHAYAGDAGQRRLAWTSTQVHHVCPDVLRRFQLAPGDSAVVEDTYAVDTASATGLGAGRYMFSVSIIFLDPSATSPEYPAGTLLISR